MTLPGRTTMMSRACALLMGVACLVPTVAAAADAGPFIDIEALQAREPGWQMTGASGDAAKGEADAEQIIWPMWFLHWRPAPGDAVGGRLEAKEARKIIEGLWEDFVIDDSIDPRPITLPAHEGFVAESTTQKGAMKHRWVVWVCPESGRLIVVDAGLSLQLNADPVLFDWMVDMARTVKCHEGAEVASFPHLPLERVVPSAELSFHHPRNWRPLKGYRMVRRYGDTDLRPANAEAIGAERGQDLILSMNPLDRLHFDWGPPPDIPITWEYLSQRAKDYWFGRSRDMMPVTRLSEEDIWIFEGIVRLAGGPTTMPPTHMHKFRAWLWRRDGVEYFAVGSVAGVLYGPRRPGLEFEEWPAYFEGLREACRSGAAGR